MANPAIEAQIHQPFDIHGGLAPEITLDQMIPVDDFAYLGDFRIAHLVDAPIRRNAGYIQNFERLGAADPEYIGQRDADLLVCWNVDACNSGQDQYSSQNKRRATENTRGACPNRAGLSTNAAMKSITSNTL